MKNEPKNQAEKNAAHALLVLLTIFYFNGVRDTLRLILNALRITAASG